MISGIIYPSVATSALGDNVAILPSEVDKKMALLEVNFLTVYYARLIQEGGLSNLAEMRVIAYDCARPAEDGTLVWGQRSQLLPKGEARIRASDLRVLSPETPQWCIQE